MSVAVRRLGNLNQYAIVLCRTEQGTATASSGPQPGGQDYVEYAGQVGWGRHGMGGYFFTWDVWTLLSCSSALAAPSC